MTSGWTEERIERLRELWPTDMGCKEIAQDLGGGMTKNGIISKARRLKLAARAIVVGGVKVFLNRKPVDLAARRPRPTPEERIERKRASDRLRQAHQRAKQREEPNVQQQSETHPDAPPVPLEPVENVIPIGQRCSILELTEAKCHWPIGDPGQADFFFCGGKSLAGLPYCGFHCAAAFNPNPYRTKSRAW